MEGTSKYRQTWPSICISGMCVWALWSKQRWICGCLFAQTVSACSNMSRPAFRYLSSRYALTIEQNADINNWQVERDTARDLRHWSGQKNRTKKAIFTNMFQVQRI